MKKIIPLFLVGMFAGSALIFAQFTPEELSQRSEIEEILKMGEIIKAEEIGTGVTRPYRLTLKTNDLEIRGAWKNPKGMTYGYLEGWQYEIAAYELDKILGLNMIPPTVERVFQGKKGSLQYWVKSTMSDLQRMDKGISIPSEFEDGWSKQKYLLRAFDSLIGNEDRTQENIIYAEDWRVILIDHSRSFRSSKEFTARLMYGRNGIKGEKLFRALPKTFVDKLKNLTYEDIQAAVESYLTENEIKAVLKRRQLLLDEIEEMIKEQGEAAVLY